jgi:RimJ/RimL family protein N-acetyltransferase
MKGKWPRAEPITTERLDLEPLRLDHAREMAHVLDDPALYRYTGGSPPSEEELSARYARQSSGVSPDGRQGWLNWVLRLRSDGGAVGIVQCTLTEQGDAVNADLAWVVGIHHQGAGVATEAAVAMIGWLRGLGIAAFTAHIHPDHAASAAVARRLGLAQTPLVERGETRWATVKAREH